MSKTKFTAIFLMILFIGTTFYHDFDSSLNEQNSIQNEIQDPKDSELSKPIIGDSTQFIDYDSWYLGESISTNIEFNPQTMELPLENYWLFLGDDPDFDIRSVWDAISDDGNTMSIAAWRTDGRQTSDGSAEYSFKVYCGGSGKFYYEFYMSFGYFTSSTYYLVTGNTVNAYLTVDSNMLDAQGYLHLYFYILHTGSSAYCYFYYWDSSGDTSVAISLKSGLTIDGCMGFTVHMDEMQFTRDTITNNVRSTYKYNSPTTKTFKVSPPGVTFAKEQNIYYNKDRWTYSSITPYASVTVAGGVATINSPTEIDYEVLFTSNCTNYLAIKDASNTLLNIDNNFESSLVGMANHPTLPFETFELATSITFDGSSSLRLYDSNVDSNYIYFTSDVQQYVYVDFWYYVDSFSGTNFFFRYSDGSNFINEALDTTTLNRWQHYYGSFYAETHADVDSAFCFGAISATVDIYIDNFIVSDSSASYSESEISATLISWDGYKNPVMTDTLLNFKAYQRTEFNSQHQRDSSLIDKAGLFTTSAMTNEYGVATVIISQGLMQEEIELLVWNWDSYFVPDALTQEEYKVLNTGSEETGWSLGFEKSGTETKTLTETEKGYTIQFEFTYDVGGHNTAYLTFLMARTGSDWDGTGADFVSFYTRSNNTVHRTQNKYLVDYWSSERSTNETDGFYQNDWVFEIDDLNYPTIWNEPFDRNDLHEYLIYNHPYALTVTDFVKIEIADFHFIHAVKNYFTPSIPTETDYATDILHDAWDWSEGDKEDFILTLGTNDAVENGYYEWVKTDTNYFSYIQRHPIIDGFEYSHYYARVWSNSSDYAIQYRFRNSLGAYISNTIGYTIANEWVTVYWDLMTQNHWNGIIAIYNDGFGLILRETTQQQLTDKFRIDFIELVHKDSWLEETNDYATDELLDTWDFNEGDTEVQSDQRVDLSVGDGILTGVRDAYDSNYLILDFASASMDYAYWNTLVMLFYWTSNDSETSMTFKVSDNTYTYYYTADAQSCGTKNQWNLINLDFDSNLGESSTVTKFIFIAPSITSLITFKIDYIYLIHQEEMSYSTIQNSVLLESESNNYQYNLWLDHALIGTFSDLSLIPLIQSAGTHYIAVQPFKTDQAYSTQNIYSYYYTVEADSFAVSLESFYLSDLYVNTFVTSNYDGTYIVYEDGTPEDSGTLYKDGTTIITNRDVTPGASINYTIAFSYGSEMVAFKTWYNNPDSDFFVTLYSVDINTTITVTWETSKSSIDSLTIFEDGVEKVTDDTASPTSWTKSTVAGTHVVTLLFEATDYNDILYSFVYTIAEEEAFSVSVESFYLSDSYVNTYVTASYDYDYYIYEDDFEKASGSGNYEGTAISSNRNLTEGLTIDYAIKFVNGSNTIWFNTSYSNALSTFYVESYAIVVGDPNIEITWDTTKDSTDSLTVYEDGVLKVDEDPTSTSSWAKSTSIGVHYVTLIFEATNYENIIYSFTYEIVSELFEVNIESFYLSELYVSTYITASENGNYQVYENNTAIPSDSPTAFYWAGTSIQTDRNTTEATFINYAIKFWNTELDTIWFNTTYSNTAGDFFVSDYSVNLGETTITITWATSLPDSDYLTIKEDGVTKVALDETSPTDFPKSTVVGTHVVTLLFQADGYTTITYSFNYHIYAVEDFKVDVGSFQVSDTNVSTYASANYNGNYYVYEDNIQIDTGVFSGSGTVIETSRDTTSGATISYAVKFVYDTIEIWFNTTYSNAVDPFYLTDYRVEDGTTITVTWDTTLPALDTLTVYEDGAIKVDADPSSTSTWTKSIEVGNHFVTLIFSAVGYDDIIHSFSYTVAATASFSVSVESFYLSDIYVNTYVTSNRNGDYDVYEANVNIGSGTLSAIGTTISSNKNTTEGLTINYAIKFYNGSDVIWFNTTYSNPASDFFITEYSIEIGYALVFINWATSLSTIDNLTIYEDGAIKVDADLSSPTNWAKNTTVGTHYVTAIFGATNYIDILYSFTYVITAIEEFQVHIDIFYVSDDYANLYVTSNYDYSYNAYTNGTPSGSGNGLSVGTFIIIPKTKSAGLFNLTVAFEYGDETVLFMTWYSNLIPPPEPSNTIYREQSQGFYNITIETNLDFYWIDIYHDDSLIYDDSTSTFYSIAKDTAVGYHNISVYYIYNCSTDSEGYPIAEYNITLSYTFWYETVLFFETWIRYIPMDLGLAIGEFEASWVKTYLDGNLVGRALITDLDEYSNYSFISYEEIFIRNSIANHELVVTDLFDRVIINMTINLSAFKYNVIELPIYRLGILNLDTESHIVKVRPYLSGEAWQESPELAYGQSIEFWVCNRTYEFKVYSVNATYYESGVLIRVWDEDKTITPPPREVPITIIIDPEEDESTITTGDSIWANPLFWLIGIGIILISIIYYFSQKKWEEIKVIALKNLEKSSKRRKEGKVPKKQRSGW